MNGDILVALGISNFKYDTSYGSNLFLSRCPRRPRVGERSPRWSWARSPSSSPAGVSRRFDGDDTLENVLDWLGGCDGPQTLDKMRRGE